jgi:hypothetical protein
MSQCSVHSWCAAVTTLGTWCLAEVYINSVLLWAKRVPSMTVTTSWKGRLATACCECSMLTDGGQSSKVVERTSVLMIDRTGWPSTWVAYADSVRMEELSLEIRHVTIRRRRFHNNEELEPALREWFWNKGPLSTATDFFLTRAKMGQMDQCWRVMIRHCNKHIGHFNGFWFKFYGLGNLIGHPSCM